MKIFKILLALVCIAVLTMSVISLKKASTDDTATPTYKEYKSKDLLAVDKRKLKIKSQA